ncbi:uncharacterized protein EV154DRAFT_548564 [Mucor mucedo]|uniref:uncharacterized protein n=1 Tax=Mucor mucedo TaxID=29922 RepID=UPI002220C2D0|nr:uncharacterized protein EV154DRAFT_548564 [Mucor mucedo]KAI7894976.1 hypothetical protein EV154DRAFT_548564 [Mucor mucedo]
MSTTSENAINLKQGTDAYQCKTELEFLKSLKAATGLKKQQTNGLLINNENVLRRMNAQSLEVLNEKREPLGTTQNKLAHLQQELTTKGLEAQKVKPGFLRLKDTGHNLDWKLCVTSFQKSQTGTTLRSFQQDHEQYGHQRVCPSTFMEDMKLSLLVNKLKDCQDLKEKLVTLKKEKKAAIESTREAQVEKQQLKEQMLIVHNELTTAVQEREHMESSLKAIHRINISRDWELLDLKYESLCKPMVVCPEFPAEKSFIHLAICAMIGLLDYSSRQIRHQELSALHQEHVAHTQEKISTYEDTINSIIGERDSLQLENTELEADLKQEKEHLEETTRQLKEKEDHFNNLHRDLLESKRNNSSIDALIEEQDITNNVLKENKLIKNQLNEVKQECDSLNYALVSTTYQLQYLLSDVQRRKELTPVEPKDCADVLGSTKVSHNLPSEKLTYKDVASLQDLIKSLTYEVVTLKQELQQKTDELTRENTQRNIDYESHKSALASLQSSINTLQNERLYLIQQRSNLQQQSNRKDYDFELTKRKLRDLENKVYDFDKEKIFLESRLKSTTASYNAVKEALHTESARRAHAINIIEATGKQVKYINRNQAHIATLLKELEYKTATVGSMQTEAGRWAELEEDLKKRLLNSERQCKFLAARVEELVKKEDSNKEKEDIEEEKKKLEEELKTMTFNYLTLGVCMHKKKEKAMRLILLQKTYNNMLFRLHSLQQERAVSKQGVNTHRRVEEALKAFNTTLKGELKVVRSTLRANSAELTRLEAQNSMALNNK